MVIVCHKYCRIRRSIFKCLMDLFYGSAIHANLTIFLLPWLDDRKFVIAILLIAYEFIQDDRFGAILHFELLLLLLVGALGPR